MDVGLLYDSHMMMMVLLAPLTQKVFCARSRELLRLGPYIVPVWAHACQYVIAVIVIAGVERLWQTPP